MKQLDFVFAGFFIIALVGFLSMYFIGSRNDEPAVVCPLDVQICADGNTVSRIAPSCEFAACPPTENTVVPPVVIDPVQDQIDAKADLIVIETPLRGATTTSPLVITGKARGPWYSEGNFPIIVLDAIKNIIGTSTAVAQGDSMTEDFVPFVATTTFMIGTSTVGQSGTIIFKKDNPSDLPENDDSLEIPVVF